MRRPSRVPDRRPKPLLPPMASKSSTHTRVFEQRDAREKSPVSPLKGGGGRTQDFPHFRLKDRVVPLRLCMAGHQRGE